MKINNISELTTLLSRATGIVITTHTNPDGDAIGSSLALYHYFKEAGKNVSLIVPNKYPEFISWLPGNEEIIVFEDDRERSKSVFSEADVVFCLDYNALHRSGSLKDPIAASAAFRIMIDHHPEPEIEEFDYIISTTETSSTAELIYNLIIESNGNQLISKEIASSLYVGIMTDTGSFSFACNRPSTFYVCAKLLETGIDGEWIHRMVYDTFSEDRLRLLGYSLSDKLVVHREFATAYIALSKVELKKFNFQVGDTEGIVNYALSIKGVTMAVLLTERRAKIRLSFRSKGNFSVNEIAKKHFQGGGHKNAAGGNSYETLDNTVKKLEDLLTDYKEELLKSEE